MSRTEVLHSVPLRLYQPPLCSIVWPIRPVLGHRSSWIKLDQVGWIEEAVTEGKAGSSSVDVRQVASEGM